MIPDSLPDLSSFFLGGFECSSHCRASGRRLDMIQSTKHDVFAAQDYFRLRSVGINSARDGLRWHRIETRPGNYDFASAQTQILAAKEHGITVIWDVCHYGWPDDINIFRAAFVERIGKFAAAFVRHHIDLVGMPPILAPVNEPSFFAWAGGQIGLFNPCARRRGDELKEQLVRASLSVMNAAREVDRGIRFVHTDPIIHVVGEPGSKRAQNRANAYREAQFQAWDMISGRLNPHLGGHPDYLDVIGANYYPSNQWMVHKASPGQRHPPQLTMDHPLYLPLRQLLLELHERYGRPILLAETGTEGEARPSWFRYVCDEVAAARELGANVGGVCLYPIVNHPGWTNNRHCHNGLWDYASRTGEREIYQPLAEELHRQTVRFEAVQKHAPGYPSC